MSYQALYRKYRPITFDEVYGQVVAKKTLLNTIKMQKISHAYLFSGPRGTGKTTIAKIFAKTVNCLEPQDGNPCLKCKSCLEIARNECADIIEIDAASNNGVDEIRELRSKVSLVPSSLKYKVYIIDEVHMLSIGAFNALLKTLEEPPAHAIFVLATTDLHKVPITIVSRCQCFQFKRLSNLEIVNRLREISDIEKISIDDAVLESIAVYADGGMRDALGMLDKLISYTSEHITITDMHEINGVISKEEIEDFILWIKEGDNTEVLEKIDFLYQNGKDLIRLVEEMICSLRDQLVKKYVDNDLGVDDRFITSFASFLNILLNRMKESSNIKVLLEIELLQYMNQDRENNVTISENQKQTFDKNMKDLPEKVIESVKNDNSASISEQTSQRGVGLGLDKVVNTNTTEVVISDVPLEQDKTVSEKVESVNQSEVESKELSDKPNLENVLQRKKRRIYNTLALATKSDLITVKEQWQTIIDFSLDREIGAIACFLTDGTPVAASSKNIILTFSYPSLVERGSTMIEKIESTIEKMFSHSYAVAILTPEEWEEEKKLFIDSKNNNISYEYMEEPEVMEVKTENKPVVTDDNIASSAIELFGKSIVKVD